MKVTERDSIRPMTNVQENIETNKQQKHKRQCKRTTTLGISN